MAAPTVADLAVIAPSLSADSRAETFLAMAIRRHAAEEPRWSDVYVEAMCYYAAHRLQKVLEAENAAAAVISGSSGGAPAGPVISRTAGRVSEAYANLTGGSSSSGAVTAGDSDLSTTPYGRAYVELRNSRAFGGAYLVVP